MSAKPILNPRNFPRPPALERLPHTRLEVRWRATGEHILDCRGGGFRVLETWHPPTYYLPPSSVISPLQPSSRRTYCEWKGSAAYWTVPAPSSSSSSSGKAGIANRVWSYESPTPSFAAIKGYVSFYADSGSSDPALAWDCYVDGERVEAQPGDFYGGWMTSDVQGPVKGGPGTLGW